ncbi:hypothetical protein KP509_12G059500 [Ceratopteris richardii]|uniref:Uncharacterized protein n=1 Tax=Ceratopteris richardii TaxID=49495 RepID=A0A8T2TQ27_CERRI|nr:hypothetical protein KP509_12G059500 [Ceratopteris richardii]
MHRWQRLHHGGTPQILLALALDQIPLCKICHMSTHFLISIRGCQIDMNFSSHRSLVQKGHHNLLRV